MSFFIFIPSEYQVVVVEVYDGWLTIRKIKNIFKVQLSWRHLIIRFFVYRKAAYCAKFTLHKDYQHFLFWLLEHAYYLKLRESLVANFLEIEQIFWGFYFSIIQTYILFKAILVTSLIPLTKNSLQFFIFLKTFRCYELLLIL